MTVTAAQARLRGLEPGDFARIAARVRATPDERVTDTLRTD